MGSGWERCYATTYFDVYADGKWKALLKGKYLVEPIGNS